MAADIERIEKILTDKYFVQNYVQLVHELLYNMEIVAPDKFRNEYTKFRSHIAGSSHIGNYTAPDGKKIVILAVQLLKRSYVEGSRSTQRSYAKKLIENAGADAAIIAFYTEGEPKWRLSFVRLDYEMKFENGKLHTAENLTPAKRYSFMVGKEEPCHTAVERLRKFITDKNFNPSLDELEEAFSVESVTNEFFNLYCDKFKQLLIHLEDNPDFVIEAEQHNFTAAQFAKKLMGQIVFLYFLQKKGWLGVGAWPDTLTEKEYKDAFFARGAKSRELIPIVYHMQQDGNYHISLKGIESLSDADEAVLAKCVKGKPWGSGPHNFMRKLFELSEKRNANFFDDYLEPLFYNALNQNRADQGYYDSALHCRIPFLSGGLFEPIDGYDWEHNDFAIPNEVFSNRINNNPRTGDGILDIFDRYNFTMSEDEPMEREVAIDPEMLGKVFENLLEINDRKAKGAFYTPREIVHYMCQESLISYLTSTMNIDEDSIRDFILYGDYFKDEDTVKEKRQGNAGMYISEQLFKIENDGTISTNRLVELDKALADVRIVDPAVGSGAFPLGILNEIVRARQNISAYMAINMKPNDIRLMYQLERSPYSLKYETIRNCIFAADIEPSAVDIAQLRLWLSLVIDDEINPDAANPLEGHRNPLPLPNLECNILCGDSLVDEFEGTKLIKESDLFGNSAYQMDINHSRFETVVRTLIDKQNELFKCDNTEKKNKLKDEIESLRDVLIMDQLYGCDSDKIQRYNNSKMMASKPYVLWQLDFVRIFREKGGFDIVIGNPPYKLCQPSNTNDYYLDYYKNNFKVASYKIDLFHLFFEKGIILLKSKGVLGYITPNTYWTNKYMKPLRKYILDNCRIHTIVNHDKIFDSASVDTATIVMSKEKYENNTISVLQSSNYIFTEICKKEQTDWCKDENYIFNINNEDTVEIKNCIRLGEICKTYFGIQAYNRDTSISKSKINEHYVYLIDGADINPYSYAEPKLYFNYLPENIKSGGNWNVYSRERIVVRQIGKIPIVGLCKENIVGSNTMYSVYPKDDKYDLKFLLACLNSSFIKKYWKARYSDNKTLFPKIKGFQLKELPIPIASMEQQSTVTALVDKVLEAKQTDISGETNSIEEQIDSMINSMYTTKVI